MGSDDSVASAISVLLIDDHCLFRAGLAELLTRRGIHVAASVSNGAEGIRLVHELQPDVVLLDIRMPDSNGLQVLEQLRKTEKDIPVIMVTTSRDEKEIAQALRLGAKGYLLKDMEPEDLVTALHSIKRGDLVIAPELAATLARVLQGHSAEDHQRDRLSELTPREKEILAYIAEGGSNKTIGRELGIAEGTVKVHVKHLLRKLNLRSRVEAAVWAVEHLQKT